MPDPADHNHLLTMFVHRLYRVFLQREPAWEELNIWTNKMLYQGVTGTSVTGGFAYAPEFLNLPLSDEEFVLRMYEGMLGRRPADNEVAIWVSILPNIGGKPGLYGQFILAPEFIAMLQSYGVTP